MGVNQSCPYLNLVQVAAYAYDDGHIPYQNASLLHIFPTLLNIEAVYTLTLNFNPVNTVYTIWDAAGTTVLEQFTMKHRSCNNYQQGYGLGLYFGGQCPAPQQVSICYTPQ